MRCLPCIALTLTVALLLAACGPREPQPASSPDAVVMPLRPLSKNFPADGMSEKTILATVDGIDQFDHGEVWGLNTPSGTFVLGPEVSAATKSTLRDELGDARGLDVTIRYVDMPAGPGTVAHQRVTSMVIQGREYRFR